MKVQGSNLSKTKRSKLKWLSSKFPEWVEVTLKSTVSKLSEEACWVFPVPTSGALAAHSKHIITIYTAARVWILSISHQNRDFSPIRGSDAEKTSVPFRNVEACFSFPRQNCWGVWRDESAFQNRNVQQRRRCFKWTGILSFPYLSYKQIRKLISGG